MVLGALLLVFGRCGSSDDGTPANISAVFMETETTTLDAKGYATDPRLVLTGPVGTAYTVTVTEGVGAGRRAGRKPRPNRRNSFRRTMSCTSTWTIMKRALRAVPRSMSSSTADTNSR